MDARQQPQGFPAPPATPVPRTIGPFGAVFRLLTSPAAAFLLLFPTIGYYTLATYVNVLVDAESSIGGIIIRAGSLAVLVIAFIRLRRKEKRSVGDLLLPATIFVFIYGYRLLENMLILDLEIRPGNGLVLLSFFLSGILPAYVLASSERAIRDEHMTILLSLFAVLFLIGMALNREALIETAESRMMLDKINPIALAYVASNLLLFYMLAFTRSKRSMIEAVLIVPILLLIASLARSRGMIISTGVTLAIYVLALKGTRRIWVLLGLGGVAVAVGYFAEPEYLDYVTEALNRIDVHEDRSTAERALFLEGAWNQFLENPILGRYAVELQLNFYPHNIYLEALMAVGLVGAVPLFLHVGMALRAAVGLIREPEGSFARSFVALLFIRDAIGAAASGSLWGNTGFWITSFLVIAMWYGRQRDQRLLLAQQWRRQGMLGARAEPGRPAP
jgi:O-antigen ligase